MEVAEKLGTPKTRVSEIESGKIDRFDFDSLVTLATRAGLDPSGRFATFTEWDSEADRKESSLPPSTRRDAARAIRRNRLM